MTNLLTKYVCAALFLTFLVGAGVVQASSLTPLEIKGKAGVHRFFIEEAVTDAQRHKGLMFRETLPKDQGMLFTYSNEQLVRMWMKNTPLSLDMLFIDSRGYIVYIAEKTTPYSTDIISSGQPVSAVLELVGGVVAEQKIELGDRVIYAHFKP